MATELSCMENKPYTDWLHHKIQSQKPTGIKGTFFPKEIFGFQKYLTEWALLQSRGAILADCGLGKTIMLLTWAQNIVEHTNKNVLIVAPLAVSHQTKAEGEKFGVEVHRSKDGTILGKITVTNYESLNKFNYNDFAGIVCDESSRIKSSQSKTRIEITEFLKKIPFRLMCTATAAPNDYLELGTSSEALGYLGFMDMLNKFFKNDQGNSAMKRMYGESPKWRFRGHAELPFWRWVCSWARSIRKPSDIGFNDDGFILPGLIENEHVVEAKTLPPGMLFPVPAKDLREQREERKRTIEERCDKVRDIVNHKDPSLIWCHYNAEGDWLEKNIPDCIQVSGRDSDEKKEEKFLAFINGEVSKLVTKPKIGAWGLNMQHCSHVVTFPSHSYEQLYQGVRRCWRFGQKKEVVVDTVLTEGERKVMINVQRKAKQADEMFSRLVEFMKDAQDIRKVNHTDAKLTIPSWVQ